VEKVLEAISAKQINVRGVVQGVGFRPFVYLLARQHGLSGYVFNTPGDVTIVLEGRNLDIERFLRDLRSKAPPQSHVESVEISECSIKGYQSFEIRESRVREDDYQLISPDLATCQACRDEIFNPSDRRYRYPFTNCTNCGPRFTIIRDIPYDRPRTTMHKFKMCPSCQAEYDNPLDRRFHAQPNACPVCGPRLELLNPDGERIKTDDVIAEASCLLRKGKILAIKGLGGFLLCCDATNDGVVRLLRQRKRRPSKPFAIMVKNLDEIRKYCALSEAEEQVLISTASPIVLLRNKENNGLSSEIAPGLKHIGIMLPYTPLHHILLHEIDLPLVMTSGNYSEEPIASSNEEALHKLKHIADYFLVHDRDIYSRYDDSVVMVEKNVPLIVRRARGYAPYPVALPFDMKQIMACGAELKNTFCLTRDKYAFISQHIGDMENEETLEHFEETLKIYCRLFRIKPELIACDMHPDYLPVRWAENRAKADGLPLIRVQHHHAHVVSCMAENSIFPPVIGVAMDGTGYGTDGHIWGGEFLIADYKSFRRAAHLEYLPLPGGEAAIARPYRTAIGYLYQLFGDGLPFSTWFKGVSPAEIDLIMQQVKKGINSPLTSSCGRLFDAVSALLGIRQVVSYEGQAAAELEAIASESGTVDTYPFGIQSENGIRVIQLAEMLSELLADFKSGVENSLIAAKFHLTLARMTGEVCSLIASETGIRQVVLSGGVFQNRLLFNLIIRELEKGGLKPVFHRLVPCNDGGISLGQAVVANFSTDKEIGCYVSGNSS